MRVPKGAACTLHYKFMGRPSFWGARAQDVKARADKLAKDKRATDLWVRIGEARIKTTEMELI